MKFLNIGVLEFVFILLLALIILGPRKAIDAAGEVGRWIKGLTHSEFWRDIVTASKEIKDLPKKMMDEAELQKTVNELDRSTAEINQSFRGHTRGQTKNQFGNEKILTEENRIQPDQVIKTDE